LTVNENTSIIYVTEAGINVNDVLTLE